jgi:Zn finger protein HypA/HybF involved in hydrogenase expression
MANSKTMVDCPLCGGHSPTCHWCDDDGKVVEITVEELEASRESAKEAGWSEHVSIQVVDFTCGVCHLEYQVELHNSATYMVACPKCENASLQMVRGTG